MVSRTLTRRPCRLLRREETRKHVTVALNGDGGDESFAGYERYIALGLTEKYRKVPSFLRES